MSCLRVPVCGQTALAGMAAIIDRILRFVGSLPEEDLGALRRLLEDDNQRPYDDRGRSS